MGVSYLTVILRRTLFALVLCATIAISLAPAARGADERDPEEWIFSVLMLPRWTISDAIIAYQFKGGYYLPVIELAEGFEFLVEAEVDRAYIDGFASREENTFTIDGERGQYIVRGESFSLPADAVLPRDLVMEGDIYVRMDILNEIWPVEMEVNLPSITIFVEAEEELSFVRRKEREERQTIFEARQEQAEKQARITRPFRENAYSWFGKPALDIQSSFTYDNREKELTGRVNFAGIQQIGKMVADYSANYLYSDGNFRRPDNLRARFSRQAAEGETLFLPTLKRVEFGDISIGQRDLISNSVSGRGVVVSNAPTTRTREFDRITVEGTGPPGWELELYNNNQLIEIGVIDDDGEYRFEDVVLNFGNNRIRVIQFGPQGQIRETVEEYRVNGALLPPQDFRYRAGVVQGSRPFIPLEDDVAADAPELTRNLEASYGLNKWLTLFGSYTETPGNQDRDLFKYYTGGVTVSTPIGIGEAELYRQINGGSAYDMRFLTQLLGVRLNLRGAVFNDFESQDAGFGQNLRRLEGEIQANTKVDLPLLPPIALRVTGDHVEFTDGTATTTVNTSQSFTGGGLRFGHSTNTRFLNEIHEASTAGFNLNWSSGSWQTRGSFNYQLHPEMLLNNGTAELRYNPRDSFQGALSLSHNFQTSTSGGSVQLGYDFEDILSTLTANYQQERGWQFTLRASTSLTPYYDDREYKLASRNRARDAGVLGRIFLDHDGDGVFSEGDEPLEGARLTVDAGRSAAASNEDGFVFAAVRPDHRVDLSVSEPSLEDPYYRTASKGYSTIGRRGSMPGFEFPIVETGAIDGSVWREPSGRPVSGMRLQLVDAETGEIFMESETAFDGYYAFEFVMPGTYIVRADPTYKVNVPAETVTVSSEELYAFGVDLYLLEPAAEENAAGEADGESGGIAQLDHASAVSGTSQPAPVSPQDEGSSLVSGETSEVDNAPVRDSTLEGGRSSFESDDSGGGVAPSSEDEQQDMTDITPAMATSVRIGEHPEKTRIVMDLSAVTGYRVTAGEDGMVVLIDMPGVTWDAPPGEELPYNAVLQSFGTESLADGGTRLVLRARERMDVAEHKILPASGASGPRLYLDLVRRW